MNQGSKPKTKRNNQIIALRKRNLSFGEIAKICNISRAWACAIYWREQKKEVKRKGAYHYIADAI